MAVPKDSSDVLAAIRLGWYVAEVRGRNRFAVQAHNRKGPGAEPGAQLKLPKRTDHELPLEMERSPAELRIEAQTVLSALAGQMGVDLNGSRSSFSGELDRRAKRLAGAAGPAAAIRGAGTVLAGVIRRLTGTGKPGATRIGTATTGPVISRGNTAETVGAAEVSAPADGGAKIGARAGAAGKDDVRADTKAGAPAAAVTNAGARAGGAPGAGAPAEAVTRAGARAAGTAKAGAPAEAAPRAGARAGGAPGAGVAADGAARAGGPDTGPAAGPSESLVAAIDVPGTTGGDWDALEELIYKFDAHIQDTLIAKSDTMSCGYQLGRALAECYWALDPSLPDKPQTWESWTFLLGRERCGEIERLLGRLSPYFHPYTAAAIAGSVQVWNGVAKSPAWQTDAYPKLYGQIRAWYELILIEQDPTTLIRPYKVLTNYRLVWRTLRGFWVQLLTAALATAAVAVFAWLLTKPSFSSWVKTLLAAVGIAGFSVAGLAAKVKNDAQAMLTRLKQDAYTDLITEAITTAPLPPRSVQAPKSGPIGPLTRKAKMTNLMRERSITPITPL